MTTNPSGLLAKRLQLLRELMPDATRISLLVSYRTDPQAEVSVQEVQAAVRAGGQEIQVINVRNEGEFDPPFAEIQKNRSGALLVHSTPFLVGRRAQVVTQVAKIRIPASYAFPEFVEAGGLMSYGVDLADVYRLAGGYVGRILKGTKPADLPVLQPTVFELVVNARTAKALGIRIPQSILLRADRVIE